MPIKGRRIKILLMLFLMQQHQETYVALTPLLLKIFDITFNQKTKGTLSTLLRDNYIKKNADQADESTEYQLTDKGFYKLCLEFPSFRYTKDEWDGIWRIISYEIPETKRHMRDRLRREMRGWGLGPWHRSFWITPHPIIGALKDLVYGREEEQYIQAFESTHMFGDIVTLVEKVWNKTELEQMYKDLFKSWHTILSRNISKDEKLQDVIYAYIKQLRNDPGLPSNVVGNKWIGNEAYDIFKEMRSILLAK